MAKRKSNTLPGWAKGGATLAAIGGGALLIYLLLKKIKDLKSLQTQSAKTATQEYNELAKKDTLTFAKSTYATTAETIANLLSGCETESTELQVIGEFIKVCKKQIDIEYLKSVFGNRTIDDCGPFGSTDYSLGSLLKDQLDTAILVTNTPKKLILGNWNVPTGYYSDSIEILDKYLKQNNLFL